MDKIPRQKLQYIIKKYGIEVCEEPNKLEAMLRDLCPEYKREINLLIGAQKEKIAADLITSSPTTPKEILFPRFTQRMSDNLGTAEEFAKWAVESWAFALDIKLEEKQNIISQEILSEITVKDIQWWQKLGEEWKRLLIRAIGINRKPNKQELMDIINLQSLDCNTSEISNLEPIEYLSQLKILDCSFNLISSLKPLQSLIALQEINCSLNILINDLTPLNKLKNLEKLDCSFSSINNLSAISPLKNLKILDCRETPLSENEIILFKRLNPHCDLIF